MSAHPGKKRVKKVYPKPATPNADLATGDRCVYCGKHLPAGERIYTPVIRTRRFPVCSEGCQTAVEKYVRADKRHKIGLYLTLLVCAVVILIAALNGQQSGIFYNIAILLAGIGFVLFPYPITSFETFQSCPVKKVTLICRVIGMAFVVFAVLLMVRGV